MESDLTSAGMTLPGIRLLDTDTVARYCSIKRNDNAFYGEGSHAAKKIG